LKKFSVEFSSEFCVIFLKGFSVTEVFIFKYQKKNCVRVPCGLYRAQRPGQAQRRREARGYPPTSGIQLARAEEGKAELSGMAERCGEGGFGGLPDYDTTQHAHAQKKAKCSGQAGRCEEGGFGVSPDYGNPAFTHAEEGQAERRAQKWGSGVFLYYDTKQQAHAQKKAKRSGEAERSEKGGFEGLP
jgi:hypothetical protein